MAEYLRSLMQADRSRWQPMLMGLACLAAAAGGAVLAQDYWLISLLLSVLAFAAWVVGACAMVGYVRWLFAAEVERMKKNGPR
jgi:hypothetical protein